ncbi:hypothetical protein CR513_50608, partial [Mucuna pruriens]
MVKKDTYLFIVDKLIKCLMLGRPNNYPVLGELGLREMSTINQASMMKLGWRLVNNRQDL